MKCKRLISVFLCTVYLVILLAFTPGCSTEQRDAGNHGNYANSVQKDTATDGTQPLPESTGNQNNTGGSEDSDHLNTDGSLNELPEPLFTESEADIYIQPEYAPVQYTKEVQPYKVKADLSNIENLEQFGSFTAEQKKLLSANGFFVAPSEEEQLFYIYERNLYLKLPSFVTADSVLQVYHVFFDYSLRTLEAQKLLGVLEQLTDSMLNKSIQVYNNLGNSEVKAEALANAAYFGVAQLALKKALPDHMPAEAKQLAEQEFAFVSSESGFERSPIFGYDLDYSQYKPRGHYTRSEDLERYFRAMMWYGQAPFALFKEENGQKVPDIEKTTRALLLTYCIYMNANGSTDAELWEKIYNPTNFYVGSTDDLNIYDFKEFILKVYGTEMDLDGLMNEEKMAVLFQEAEKLPEPRIQAMWTGATTPVGKQFRFMGQRYIPDSEILQKLVEPILRPMPSGLDVMGVLGSDRAYSLLINEDKIESTLPEYPAEFTKLKNQFLKLPETTWRSNMYYGWLWTLKSLLSPFGKGYPTFMTTEAWQDKSLNTALGSWSELRHDTILYGKKSGAEMGGGDLLPVIRSYVEPNIELYEKLLWITRYSRENLTRRDILPEELQNRMERFEKILEFLINCSVKELRNEELTKEEYDTLLTYGGMLESLTSSLAENRLRWFEITSETDRNMAVIADVHTVFPDYYLETGVGSADQIFVVVPIGGKLYLTRGASFSYYEFVSRQRLTDEEWQGMLKEKKQPAQPEWMKSFQGGEKEALPVPKEPYNG